MISTPNKYVEVLPKQNFCKELVMPTEPLFKVLWRLSHENSGHNKSNTSDLGGPGEVLGSWSDGPDQDRFLEGGLVFWQSRVWNMDRTGPKRSGLHPYKKLSYSSNQKTSPKMPVILKRSCLFISL